MSWYSFLLRPFAAPFIAGESVHAALAHAKRVQRKGIGPIFDILGESATTKEDAVRVGSSYIHLLDQMRSNGVHGAISLKLTAFALDADEETAYRAVLRVVRHAKLTNTIVWIDMEGSGYTSETIRVYKRLLGEADNVGICIQAYLKRAKKDILSLLPDNPKIRIVKGVYPQKSALVYTTHHQINQHFKELLTLMSEKDAWTAVGTHDMEIISHGLALPFPTHLEFQMLKGIRNDEKKLLAEHGYHVMEYIPFGPHWEKYVVRRFGERLRNWKWIILGKLGLDK